MDELRSALVFSHGVFAYFSDSYLA